MSDIEQAKHILLSIDMCSDHKSRLEVIQHVLAERQAAITAARIDELESLDHNKQMFGDWQQVIEDRITEIKQNG